jgi:hypothetical protein
VLKHVIKLDTLSNLINQVSNYSDFAATFRQDSQDTISRYRIVYATLSGI